MNVNHKSYHGKTVDRYQDEIRKAAARSVRDLNLSVDNALTSRSHQGLARKVSSSSLERGKSPVICNGSVSAAAAKIEQMQRYNQVNGSATMVLQGLSNDAEVNSGRRKSLGPVIGQNENTTGMIANAKQGLTNPQSRIIADFAFGGQANSTTMDQFGVQDVANFQQQDMNLSQYSNTMNDNVDQQFQPGTYPQLKRSSLTSIPIYENIDGYPDVISHQIPNKDPPPYSGSHTIVGPDVLSRRNSRTSVSSLESRITNGGSPGSSGSKNYPTIAELTNLTSQLNLVSHAQQQHPLLKPPVLPPKAHLSSKVDPMVSFPNHRSEVTLTANLRPLPPNYENLSEVETSGKNIVNHLRAPTQTMPNNEILLPSKTANGMNSLSRSDQSSVLFRDYVNLPPPPPYPGTTSSASSIEHVSNLHGHSRSNGSNGKDLNFVISLLQCFSNGVKIM